MKILGLIISMMVCRQINAATGYDIQIDKTGYELNIELLFNDHQSLQNVRSALMKSEVISQLSPNIVSVTNNGSPENYQSVMVVESFGLKSNLLSNCSETRSEKEWKRACTLQTDLLDGGKYMVSKSDEVSCARIGTSVSCMISIRGQTKPLTIFGIQILNAGSFAAKAKAQALNNFFKLYYFIENYNTSTRVANQKFEKSKVSADIEEFEKTATQDLKKELPYRRSFRL